MPGCNNSAPISSLYIALFIVTLFLTANVSAATFAVNTTADTQDAVAGNGICADVNGMGF